MDGIAIGAGFTLVLVALGGMRELAGQGTLLSHAHLMFGEIGHSLSWTVIEDYRGFLLAILPPGAFIGLGFLIAGMNFINERRTRRVTALAPDIQPSRA